MSAITTTTTSPRKTVYIHRVKRRKSLKQNRDIRVDDNKIYCAVTTITALAVLFLCTGFLPKREKNENAGYPNSLFSPSYIPPLKVTAQGCETDFLFPFRTIGDLGEVNRALKTRKVTSPTVIYAEDCLPMPIVKKDDHWVSVTGLKLLPSHKSTSLPTFSWPDHLPFLSNTCTTVSLQRAVLVVESDKIKLLLARIRCLINTDPSGIERFALKQLLLPLYGMSHIRYIENCFGTPVSRGSEVKPCGWPATMASENFEYGCKDPGTLQPIDAKLVVIKA